RGRRSRGPSRRPSRRRRRRSARRCPGSQWRSSVVLRWSPRPSTTVRAPWPWRRRPAWVCRRHRTTTPRRRRRRSSPAWAGPGRSRPR
ncbi:MAG: PE family protein, partial [Acidimicrobiales bacterium]